ncbi:MAG: rRNA pseudouridine synthase [Clostridia bacterium]|nr:rRNA pseudouridine synthase [Clostridia bacterium]
MERLDKVIVSQGVYSRKDVKKLVSQKRVTVEGKLVTSSDIKIDSEKSIIAIDGKELNIKKYLYLILNKPKGYISATEDKKALTVLDLVPDELFREDLFPAGRLDKDTTGLMIITNDGMLAHNILSPKKHVKKIYEVTIDIPVTEKMVKKFAEGIKLNDGECKPGKLEITGEYTCRVTISEGRYHQIKRMFGCLKAKVVELNRICIGNFELPNNLNQGECRELTENELLKLQEK